MFRSASLALAFVGLAGLARSQDVKVEKYQLKNGLTVILHEDHTVPLVTVNLWFRVGAKDEAERRSGFAHLYEHLMFMGTDRVPTGQFDKIMEAGGGSNNASTTADRTNYFSSGPSSLLPTLLWLEADRLEDLGRTMTQKKLDLQREVVKNERRQTTEETPYGKAYEAIGSMIYPKGHPYHTSVIGSHEDLEAATVKDVQEFFSTFYVPNNASLVVAGDFKSADVKALIEKLFSSLQRRNDPPRKIVQPFTFTGVKRVTMIDKVQLPKIFMVWHSPAAYGPGDAEMNLAGQVLAGGVSSRLYQRLVVKDGLATDVSAGQDSMVLGSNFSISVTPAEGVSLDKIEFAIDDELKKFTSGGPTEIELKRQIAGYETGVLSSLQSIASKADRLNEFEFAYGEPNSFKKSLDLYRNATPRAVRDVSRKVLDLNSRLILRVLPGGEEIRVDRDKKPAASEVKSFDPPTPTVITLSNGTKVQYVQRKELPLMSFEIRFDTGAVQDTPKEHGLTALTAELATQGAGDLTAAEYENALNLLGASVHVNAGARAIVASLDVLTRNFDAGFKLFRDALTKPKLAQTDFDRLKASTISAIKQADDDPGTLARKVTAREFFGENHPSGKPISGTVDSVKALTLDQSKAVFAKRFDPSTMTVFASGSMTPDELKLKLESAMAGWANPKGESRPMLSPIPQLTGLRVLVVDKPGAVQTVVRFALPGVAYDHPDRLAYQAIGTILGGTFTSRLNSNLREEKGYTYGAGASFSFDDQFGMLVASSSVRTEVTGASLKEFLSEFKKIRSGDMTPEEVGKAVLSVRTSIIESLASLGGIVAVNADLQARGKTIQQLKIDLEAASKLTAGDLNQKAKQAVTLDLGVLVLVGDKKAILAQLAGLDLPKATEIKP